MRAVFASDLQNLWNRSTRSAVRTSTRDDSHCFHCCLAPSRRGDASLPGQLISFARGAWVVCGMRCGWVGGSRGAYDCDVTHACNARVHARPHAAAVCPQSLYKAGDFEGAMECYGEALEFGRKALEAGRILSKDLSRLCYNRGRAAERYVHLSAASPPASQPAKVWQH
jgi:hypothetical protein